MFRIADLFPDPELPPRRIDRRVDPRAGYRAVHLEVRREGILLEVQIRTALQHQWAEVFERAADRLGRGLRYGEKVDFGATAEIGESVMSRLEAAANVIDQLERGEIAAVFGPDLGTVAQRAITVALVDMATLLEELP